MKKVVVAIAALVLIWGFAAPVTVSAGNDSRLGLDGALAQAVGLVNVPCLARVDTPVGSWFGPVQVPDNMPMTIWPLSIVTCDGHLFPLTNEGAKAMFGGKGAWVRLDSGAYVYAPSSGSPPPVVGSSYAAGSDEGAVVVEGCPSDLAALEQMVGGSAQSWAPSPAGPGGWNYRGPDARLRVPSGAVLDYDGGRLTAGQSVVTSQATLWCLS